ncbi:MAG TPA: hypothetical protein VNL71_03330 [Chloroflexota bacterium]|nr:hypothetical protein [Chloroflexota bacterium]
MKKLPTIAQIGLGILLGSGVGFALAHQTTPTIVNAEERGLRIPLSYVHGLSNWGPTNVQGKATIWPQEGVAELSLHFLPRLSNGDQYTWWVMNSSTGASLRLASFNTNDAGDAYIDTYLPAALPHQANMVLIAVTHPGDPAGKPGSQRSLSGYMLAPSQPDHALPGQGGIHASGSKGSEAARNGQARAPFQVVALPQTGGGPGARGKQGLQ